MTPTISFNQLNPVLTVPPNVGMTPIGSIPTTNCRKLTVTGTVGGPGPITGLQLSCASRTGGVHVPMLTNSDFSTATDTLLRSLGLSSPTNLVAGSTFQFTVDLQGVGMIEEVNLWASTTNGATLLLETAQSVA